MTPSALHPLLQAQLEALGCNPNQIPADRAAWQALLARFDRTYRAIEADLEWVHLAISDGGGADASSAQPAGVTETRRSGAVRDLLGQAVARAGQRLADRGAPLVGAEANPAMLILDREHRLLAISPLMARLSSLNAKVQRGRPIDFLTRPGEEPDLGPLWVEAARDGVWNGVLLLEDPQGSGVPVRVSLYAVGGKPGEADYFVLCLSELGDRGEGGLGTDHLGTHDPLTGLCNRVLFQDRLARAIRRAQRSGVTGALLFIDLDRFKAINDGFGHHLGDELLIRAANRLRKISRKEDLVARIGGDEFAVIVEQLKEPDQAGRVAQKLAGVFEESFSLRGYEFHLSASVGVTIFPLEGIDPDVLLKQADAAMYRAKQQGGRGVCFYSPEVTDAASGRHRMELKLREAQAAGQLLLWYQPLFGLRDGRPVALEALLRWRHPDLGVLAAGQFLPLAELTGLIDPIGEWALAEACKQSAVWARLGEGAVRVSVNLSWRQIAKPDFARRLATLLDQAGAKGHWLELEVSEQVLQDADAVVWGNLTALRELGCRLVMDDFGSGRFSIAGLRRFGFYRLKTMLPVMEGGEVSSEVATTLEATVAMARVLGLRVAAKGIEGEAQHRLALTKGCDEVQGLFYGTLLKTHQVRVPSALVMGSAPRLVVEHPRQTAP